MLFNEEPSEIKTRLTFSAVGRFEWFDRQTGLAVSTSPGEPLFLDRMNLNCLRLVQNNWNKL